MQRWRRSAGDDGSASLEFITAGMILLVPVVYLVLTVASVQAGALAVEGAARQAARVYVQSANQSDARSVAERAIEFALADYGLEPGQAVVRVTCEPRPGDCLVRRGFVTVSVSITVPLPLVPPVLDLDLPMGFLLEASATQQVSRFWTSG